MAEVVRIDERHVCGSAERRRTQPTARGRRQDGMKRHAVDVRHAAHVLVDVAGLGTHQTWMTGSPVPSSGTWKEQASTPCRRDPAAAEEEIFDAVQDHADPASWPVVSVAARGRPRDRRAGVVLQVLADAGEVAATGIPKPRAASAGPMPESIRSCGETKGPAARSTRPSAMRRCMLAAAAIFDAGGAAVLNKDPAARSRQ